jgi:hypothetical protein
MYNKTDTKNYNKIFLRANEVKKPLTDISDDERFFNFFDIFIIFLFNLMFYDPNRAHRIFKKFSPSGNFYPFEFSKYNLS